MCVFASRPEWHREIFEIVRPSLPYLIWQTFSNRLLLDHLKTDPLDSVRVKLTDERQPNVRHALACRQDY
jgi:hypothetical protein